MSKKWIKLLEKGDKLFINKNKEYPEIFPEKCYNVYSLEPEIERININKARMYYDFSNEYINWNKTGLELIKRLWNEGKLNEILCKPCDDSTKQEKVVFSRVVPKNVGGNKLYNFKIIEIEETIELYTNSIDIDKTLEKYMEDKMKKEKDKLPVCEKFGKCEDPSGIGMSVDIDMFSNGMKKLIDSLDEFIKKDKIEIIGEHKFNQHIFDDLNGNFRCETTFPVFEGVEEIIKEQNRLIKKYNIGKRDKETDKICQAMAEAAMNAIHPSNKVVVKDMDFSALDGNEYVTSGGVRVKISISDNFLFIMANMNGNDYVDCYSENLKRLKEPNYGTVALFNHYGLELEFQESAKVIDSWDKFYECFSKRGIYYKGKNDNGLPFIEIKKYKGSERVIHVSKLALESEYNCKIELEV